MAAYAVTIFTGAFLLFQVQPLMGKYILPWFGGGPGVWTTCMLFFQVLLLGGYAYAHLTSRWLKPRTQAVLHLVLLLLAVAWLPFLVPGDSWKPQGGGNPTLQILLLLAASLGLPYFILSATGPLVQQWFSRANPGRSPYRLYALSNVGSLLALISYPIYFESHFTRKFQAGLWAVGMVAYVVFCGWCAMRVWKSEIRNPKSELLAEGHCPKSETREETNHRWTRPSPEATAWQAQMDTDGETSAGVAQLATCNLQPATAPSFNTQHATRNALPLDRLLWLLLPACASALLLAVTNKMCQDVAVIPFLWVLPLALYLLSFIICFDSPRWYMRVPFTLALVAASAAICWALFEGVDLPIRKQVFIYSAGLFVCCMVCHGELYRLRPDPRFLTGFYLSISAGGALGGMFVAVVAPLIFTDYYELHWSLMLCGLLFVVVCATRAPRAVDGVTRVKADGGESGDQVPEEPHAEVVDYVLEENAAKGGSLPARGGWRFLPWIFSPANEWRLLGCALTLVVFGGLHWGLNRFGGELNQVVAVQKVSGGLGWILAWFKSAKALDSVAVLRIVMWSLFVLVAAIWVVSGRFRAFRHWRLLTCLWLSMMLVALGVALAAQAAKTDGVAVSRSRNFYGVLTVLEYNKDDPKEHYYLLRHGRITHGLQFTDPEQARMPTSYYGAESGIGMAMQVLTNRPRHLGVIGLGTGSLTVYGRAGDSVRIYEINSAVERLANTRFSYLDNCRQQQADVKVVLGDARLSLEREPSQQFDLLALDAFSSDAIPVHLLTKESFAVYERHMNTNGIIAVHVSNQYLDLEPVVVNLARQFNYKLAIIDYDDTGAAEWWLYSSTWILLCKNGDILNSPAIRAADVADTSDAPGNTKAPKGPLWTDDFTSLYQILK